MKIFLSYSSIDTVDFKIEELVEFLEFQDDIKRVYYWARDTKGGEAFDDYMRNNIKVSDLVVVLFTDNSKGSVPVLEEIGMAKAFQKRIMPVFEKVENIVADIQSSRGVRFIPNFRMFCEDLYHKITGKKAKCRESNSILEFREEMHKTFKFNKSSYVEPELRDVTEIYKEEEKSEKKLPLISYRIFKFILFDPINRGSLNVVTAPPRSGKTIFLFSLKHDILHQEPLVSYIPFFIDAEKLKDDSRDLFHRFYDYLLPDTNDRYLENFEMFIKSGKAVILLDGLSKNTNSEELLEKLHNFVLSNNARIIITCRPVIHDLIRNSPDIKKKAHLYRLNSFKSSSLYEWVVLNKNDYEQTRQHQARTIYLILKEKVKQKEEKGERVVLPSLMQEFSI